MAAETELRFRPDYAVPPGATLLETIETLGISQAELARRTGRPVKTINEIVKGKVSITPETALQFERVLGIPAIFWINREGNYREALTRKADHATLETKLAYLEEFPVSHMIKRGWIRPFGDKVQQLVELLGYFGVASPEHLDRVLDNASEAMYRRSAGFRADPGAVAAWLRRGEIEAQSMQCSAFNEDRFEGALKVARALTLEPVRVFQPALQEICASCGVAVVFVPELPKLRIWGATRWPSPDKALIQLSLRYKTDDHLWFTFFHEAAHILLHPKKQVFIEFDNPKGEMEEEANRFASNSLIPSQELDRFGSETTYFSKVKIKRFALEIGVAPGIVVGRLQHDGYLPRSHCNGLKQRFRWADK